MGLAKLLVVAYVFLVAFDGAVTGVVGVKFGKDADGQCIICMNDSSGEEHCVPQSEDQDGFESCPLNTTFEKLSTFTNTLADGSDDCPPPNYSNDSVCPDCTTSDNDTCCPTCYYDARLPENITSVEYNKPCYVNVEKHYNYAQWLLLGICRTPNLRCGTNGAIINKKGTFAYKFARRCRQQYVNMKLACQYCYFEYPTATTTQGQKPTLICQPSYGIYQYPSTCSCQKVRLSLPVTDQIAAAP